MAKLHELLAAEKDVKTKSQKLVIEAKDTFGKKHDHFTGFTKTYKPKNDEDAYEAEALSESKEMVTTVGRKLNYLLANMVDAIDIAYQKDLTNRVAKADITVDGIVIASDVPATTLLHLEDQLRELRDVCDKIPTLKPGIKWVLDASLGEGVYVTEKPEVKIRTKKQTVYKTVAQATDKHAAQVVAEMQDVNIGKYEEIHTSGMITPADKSKQMDKIEKLIAAVKRARARANEQEVASGEIAKKLFDYITQ